MAAKLTSSLVWLESIRLTWGLDVREQEVQRVQEVQEVQEIQEIQEL